MSLMVEYPIKIHQGLYKALDYEPCGFQVKDHRCIKPKEHKDDHRCPCRVLAEATK